MLKGYLTCEMIAKLVPHYIDDKLDGFQRDCVATHLRNCPSCMGRYTVMKKFLEDVRAKHKKQLENERIQNGISAYYDGECTKSELLEIEALFCKDEERKKEYENISKLSRLMTQSFKRTSQEDDLDCVQDVMKAYKKQSIFSKLTSLLRF